MSIDTKNDWFEETHENIALRFRVKERIMSEQSDFQKVELVETYGHGKLLAHDGMIMVTEKDEFIYHDMITHVPLYTHPNPKNVLVIGGGDGGTVRELFRHQSVEEIVMVEIDEKVIEASRLHLPQLSCEFDNPKLDLRIQDGIQYLKECEAAAFDLIVIDGSDPEGPAEGLFSVAF